MYVDVLRKQEGSPILLRVQLLENQGVSIVVILKSYNPILSSCSYYTSRPSGVPEVRLHSSRDSSKAQHNPTHFWAGIQTNS